MHDFASLQISRDAVEIKIKHPNTKQVIMDTDGQPVVIMLHGRDSESYRTKRREFIDARLEQSLQAGGKVKMTAKELEDQGLATLLACVKGWRGVGWDGEELEFTPENFRLILDKCPWLEEQIDEAVSDRSNFMASSSKTS